MIEEAVLAPARRTSTPMHRQSAPTRPVEAKRVEKIPALGWILAGIVTLLWGIRLLGLGSSSTRFSLVGFLVIVVGVTVVAVHAWIERGSRPAIWLSWLVIAVVALAFVAWAIGQVRVAPGYGTDEMAFDQYAALLYAHGVNPYLHSMAPAFTRFQVSPDGFTWHMDGTPVTSLSYPALAFLVYVPLLLLGISGQVAVWVNVAAWVVSLVLMAKLVPAQLRSSVVVIGSLSIYIAYAVGGVTDVLFLPFLLVSAVDLDTYAARRGLRLWMSPVAFGLACALKQTPWILAPFFAVLLFRYARSSGRSVGSSALVLLRYGAITLVTFLVPELPFLLSHPGHFLRGILTPFSSSIMPGGQGLIALALQGNIGGGNVLWYSAASVAFLALLVFATWLFYPRFSWMVFLAPSIALLFATRSFGSYFFDLIPVAFVAAARWRTVDLQRSPTRGSLALLGAGLLGSCGIVVLALTASHPVRVTIVGVHTTGQLATVDRVSVLVANTTSAPLTPTFTVETGGSATSFWQPNSVFKSIPAHRTVRLTLVAPNFPAEPSIAGGFEVVALTQGPSSVNVSRLYQPQLLHVALVPDAINHVITTGSKVTLVAELLNQYDQRVALSGVAVYLGQAIYAQRGLVYGEADINGSAPGQTPVMVTTNRSGSATFVIVDHTAQANAISFEANLVSPTDFYPYGYSQIVPIRFQIRRGR